MEGKIALRPGLMGCAVGCAAPPGARHSTALWVHLIPVQRCSMRCAVHCFVMSSVCANTLLSEASDMMQGPEVGVLCLVGVVAGSMLTTPGLLPFF
jgi:hypothetical protein